MALVNDPEVLFLDEPTSGLDVESVSEAILNIDFLMIIMILRFPRFKQPQNDYLSASATKSFNCIMCIFHQVER
jgi:ABC-type uncharacterized transport system fused permease/ATPase subunit